MATLNRTKVQWLDFTPSAGKSSNDFYQELKRFDGWDNPKPSPMGANGTTMTWQWSGWIIFFQANFQVKVIREDDQNHLFTVETLSGHPLAGYRYWRVIDLPNRPGQVRLETVADDHPFEAVDYIKDDDLGGEGIANSHWAAMLRDTVKTKDAESLYLGANYSWDGNLNVGFMQRPTPDPIAVGVIEHGVSSAGQVDFDLGDPTMYYNPNE